MADTKNRANGQSRLGTAACPLGGAPMRVRIDHGGAEAVAKSGDGQAAGKEAFPHAALLTGNSKNRHFISSDDTIFIGSYCYMKL